MEDDSSNTRRNIQQCLRRDSDERPEQPPIIVVTQWLYELGLPGHIPEHKLPPAPADSRPTMPGDGCTR